jgi:hypothetical protein
MSATDNYLTPDGWYAAVRVPSAAGPQLARRFADDQAGADRLLRLEAACLSALRTHGPGTSAPPATLLDDLVEYHAQFIDARSNGTATSHKRMRTLIERTLLERPWERCGCTVCAAIGIQVVVFRGNNRNRRRGFHNTYTFYNLFDQVLDNISPLCLQPKDRQLELVLA